MKVSNPLGGSINVAYLGATSMATLAALPHLQVLMLQVGGHPLSHYGNAAHIKWRFESIVEPHHHELSSTSTGHDTTPAVCKMDYLKWLLESIAEACLIVRKQGIGEIYI